MGASLQRLHRTWLLLLHPPTSNSPSPGIFSSLIPLLPCPASPGSIYEFISADICLFSCCSAFLLVPFLVSPWASIICGLISISFTNNCVFPYPLLQLSFLLYLCCLPWLPSLSIQTCSISFLSHFCVSHHPSIPFPPTLWQDGS